ncbi:basic proline-rich protein-like [Ursus americanus]|uniref:basic proline-rich protein-like n=1 Tax=Ursus americanus TaxID=9643 RepID=UPI001E67C016|nr:basic proline-rich protein-like [Ursus americanus]
MRDRQARDTCASVPLGQHFVQLALKLRPGQPNTRRSGGLACPAARDLRNARRGGPAHAPRAGRDPAGADTCTSAAPPPRGRQPWFRRAARACARRCPVPPRPAVGHARCARGADGPFKAGTAERAPAPPAAPPRREVCARRPAALCALLGVGLAAEGGSARTGRRGRRAAPPPGSPGAGFRERGKKGGFEGRGTPPARRPPPRPPRSPRCPLGPRARSSPLFPASPGSPRLRARSAGQLLKAAGAAVCRGRQCPRGGMPARDNGAMWPSPRTGSLEGTWRCRGASSGRAGRGTPVLAPCVTPGRERAPEPRCALRKMGEIVPALATSWIRRIDCDSGCERAW